MQPATRARTRIGDGVASRDHIGTGVILLIALQALSLGVMAFLHLSGLLAGGSEPFEPRSAGIAEAAIGVVLAAAAVAAWRSPERARLVAPLGVGFAIIGFVVGLTITAQGGDATDIVYHATVLPLLVASLLLLVWRPGFADTRALGQTQAVARAAAPRRRR